MGMVKLSPPVPVLRVFDETKTKAFYVDFLGFEVDFEHRYAESYPLYLGVSRSGCKLHLSEHHGDCSPVAKVRIQIDDLKEFCRELGARETEFIAPKSGSRMQWGSKECTVVDPFGNKLVFFQES